MSMICATGYYTTKTVTVYSAMREEWAVKMLSTLPHKVKRLKILTGEYTLNTQPTSC